MIARVAGEERISEKIVEDIFDSIFLITKKLVQQKDAPKVKLHNFGTFYPNLNKIDRFLRTKFARYREGRISRERMVKLVQRYWPIRKRLQKELSTSRPKHGPKLRIRSTE